MPIPLTCESALTSRTLKARLTTNLEISHLQKQSLNHTFLEETSKTLQTMNASLISVELVAVQQGMIKALLWAVKSPIPVTVHRNRVFTKIF